MNLREDGQMSATPPRSGPSVALIVGIGSALIVVTAGVLIALTIMLTQRPATVERDEPDDDEPENSSIVLDASWVDGSALDEQELELTEQIITGRLEDAGLTDFSFAVRNDQIHISFDDAVDDDTLDTAADVLEVSYSADFRPVLEGGLCTTDLDLTDYGPDEEIVACDPDGFEALALGPSEIGGDTIIGATTFAQKDGGYWGVTIVFNAQGANALADLTQRLVDAEDGLNRLAIVLDGKVLSSPSVNAAILNGEVSITGSLDEAEAKRLAAQLRFASKGLELSVAD